MLKAHRTQGIQYFDSFNNFSLKQKLQQALQSQSNLSLVLFGKERGKHRPTLTNPLTNIDKSMYQFE